MEGMVEEVVEGMEEVVNKEWRGDGRSPDVEPDDTILLNVVNLNNMHLSYLIIEVRTS